MAAFNEIFDKNYPRYSGKKEFQPKREEKENRRRVFPYSPEPGLEKAVNLAIALERPLLLQGEPGCGKTLLARAVAYEFGVRATGNGADWPFFQWNIKSTTVAQEGRYTFDALGKLRDVQLLGNKEVLGQDKYSELVADLRDPMSYIAMGALGRAYETETYRPVVLIDEIDKASIDFPNDLLSELEEQQFAIAETQKTVKAKLPPIVFVTSNSEQELPEAFLRRCIFYYLAFPDEERLKQIALLHFPDHRLDKLFDKAIATFLEVRQQGSRGNFGKKAGTSELLDWLRVLTGKSPKDASKEVEALLGDKAQLGVLLKTKADVERVWKQPERAEGS
ncbi:MoxR-like ATPase [Rubidibacter lacunae KORDI 51-2]|uniref:MoxR-like ATPase n=1 Tax=Rubidibacter lacunae KORDI 51-2 TaxID=582515 RepID=U5DNT1_9CHRO|nr:MoxR family ATPase [Rubidibacter lacunae]ERN41365.1 MoxR-like ATPase [Rubidibacter lacunae KORDI 51-2]